MTAAPPPVEPLRPTARAPEPGGLWIRYAPRGWPAPGGWWLDLAKGELVAPAGEGEPPAALPELAGGPFDDVVWLPPVPPALRDERDRLAERLLAAGTPVLVQALAGERVGAAGAAVVLDLTQVLLAAGGVGGGGGEDGEPADEGSGGGRHAEAATRVESAAAARATAAVWPLIPGLTDGPDLVAAGLDALAATGVAAVQPVTPRLAPADRRRLAEGAGDEAFDRLFHGGEPDERAFARAVAARGLAFFLPRPLPRPPLAGAANRRIAADLAVAGELWLRLGRAPSQAQAFFRAARWADETGYDLPALAREGNLGVVAAVDAASRALIEEAAASGREPSLVAQLRAAYVAEEGA
ncbi:MAG TPA: hypothetical protein VF100_06065 [Thermoanaerobaculia bacterium]